MKHKLYSAFLTMVLAAASIVPLYAVPASVAVAATTVSVKDFGAKGDGVTDDSAAIQAAVNAASANGTVLIPAGTYRLSKAIIINKDYITVTGVGNETKLKMLSGSTDQAVRIADHVTLRPSPARVFTNITLSRMEIDGNLTKGAMGVWVLNGENVLLSELYIHGWYTEGVSVALGELANKNVVLERLHIATVKRNAIHFGQGTNLTARLIHSEDTPSQAWGAADPGAGCGVDVEVEGYNPYVDNVTIEDSLLERDNVKTAGCGVVFQAAYGPMRTGALRRTFVRNHQAKVIAGGVINGQTPQADPLNVTVENNWFLDDSTSVTGGMFLIDTVKGFTANNNVFNDSYIGYSSASGITKSSNVSINGSRVYNQGACAFNPNNNGQNISITNTEYIDCLFYPGSETVTASGNTKVSSSVIDKTAPTISLGVQSGQTFSTTTSVLVTASDTGSGIARIMYFIDGIPQGVIDSSSGSFTFDATRYQAGPHTLSARAWDKHANISNTATVQVTVAGTGTPPPPAPPAPTAPVINSFTATPTSIIGPQNVTLSWNVTGANLLSINPTVGTVTGTSTTVMPNATTTYTLTATNTTGSSSKTVTVTASTMPLPFSF